MNYNVQVDRKVLKKYNIHVTQELEIATVKLV